MRVLAVPISKCWAASNNHNAPLAAELDVPCSRVEFHPADAEIHSITHNMLARLTSCRLEVIPRGHKEHKALK